MDSTAQTAPDVQSNCTPQPGDTPQDAEHEQVLEKLCARLRGMTLRQLHAVGVGLEVAEDKANQPASPVAPADSAQQADREEVALRMFASLRPLPLPHLRAFMLATERTTDGANLPPVSELSPVETLLESYAALPPEGQAAVCLFAANQYEDAVAEAGAA